MHWCVPGVGENYDPKSSLCGDAFERLQPRVSPDTGGRAGASEAQKTSGTENERECRLRTNGDFIDCGSGTGRTIVKANLLCYLFYMMIKRFGDSSRSFIKKIGLILLTLSAAVSLTGCITFLTEINVIGDGSGTMVQTITMNPEQIKESMETMSKQMGAATAESKTDIKDKAASEPAEGPLKEEDLKGKAADLGQGVTFVSARKIDTKTAIGFKVTYAFKDITQLAVNPKPAAALGTEGAGVSSEDALKFRFNRTPNGNSVVTVVLPPSKPDAPKEQTSAPPPHQGEEAMMMIVRMFKGLHMGININVAGKVVKTNSPYAEGSKITLMDIDFDPLLADEKTFKTLNEKMEAAKGDDRKMLESLKGVKGIKITTDPEVSIEFTPEKKP